ncbi:DUF2336 domain-containing protein [Emcibacter nanhaiensis]|uniref:DUF2336 domain-containing protein n=1 Tax=Emcibacter nanhaiensis TaxID=1505037 RepID=A0A501PPY6_9PROT|nr:DUF2336 domain-containing protein [Emcibacter nanhaiensis]TPD62590.1 DUF2336 domain-containing protein [Emcibacter nanhaiensis]
MGALDKGYKADELIRLAADKSVSARNELVENITDLFLTPGGRLNEHERALMNDILSKLILNVEQHIRRELARRLADSMDLSGELVGMLANDKIEIARPVLEKNKLLQDAQLIEVIRNRTDAHRLAIAIREDVSAEVSDELIEHGSEDVVEALINNSSAEISEASMEYLVAESKSLDRFQEPLLSRQDLPPGLAFRMYWWVSAALRRRIIKEFEVDETLLDDAIEMATKHSIQQAEEEDSVMDKALKLVRKLDDENKLNTTFVLQALRQEKVNLAVAGLSQIAGLSVKIVWRAFRERTGESLAVIAKSIGLSKEEFTSLFLLVMQTRSGGKARATSLLKSILTMYNDIKAANARAAVRHWQRDLGYQDALTDMKEAI